MSPRWDGDNRGRGVGDAVQLVPGATELVAAFTQPAWVAEEPELRFWTFVSVHSDRSPLAC